MRNEYLGNDGARPRGFPRLERCQNCIGTEVFGGEAGNTKVTDTHVFSPSCHLRSLLSVLGGWSKLVESALPGSDLGGL